jgi:hypothetical protein
MVEHKDVFSKLILQLFNPSIDHRRKKKLRRMRNGYPRDLFRGWGAQGFPPLRLFLEFQKCILTLKY